MLRSVYGGLLSSINSGMEHPPRGTSMDDGIVIDIGTLETSTVYFVSDV